MATLALSDSTYTAVWRLLRTRLETHAQLLAAGFRLVFLDGDPESIRNLSAYNGPALRFLPQLGANAWQNEYQTTCPLVCYVEAFLGAPDIEDLFNLQQALNQRLDSVNDEVFQAALVAAGASTGLVLFAQPLQPQRGREGQDTVYRAVGQFVIDVNESLIS